jgi:hypothetical protein
MTIKALLTVPLVICKRFVFGKCFRMGFIRAVAGTKHLVSKLRRLATKTTFTAVCTSVSLGLFTVLLRVFSSVRLIAVGITKLLGVWIIERFTTMFTKHFTVLSYSGGLG